ncbi:hypothetical protein [Maricaulis sp.]|uniref:hypothetical protein n=1 Tax=Maricaulis sp. TaxID=1486257 RepID=UPI002602BE94|nr:hypothetical protein [Maricaulis sp.]
MAKADFALRTIAKTALLWLTAGLLFASLFGALLSARSDGPGIRFREAPAIVAEDEATFAEAK